MRVVAVVPWQGLHGGQPRVGSQKQAELSLTSTSGRLVVGPSQQREFARFPGSNFSVKSFSEDRLLLTSVVDEVRTEVCAPELNEKSYSTKINRRQQKARFYRHLPGW